MGDKFSNRVKIALAMKTGLTCSNPECRKCTGGPDKNIGVAAHITAASPKGPRYDKSLTPVQRKSEQNGIWLCQDCAKLIDCKELEKRYPEQLLRLWKEIAEKQASAFVGSTSPFVTQYTAVTRDSSSLLGLNAAKNNGQLRNIISDQQYTFTTTSTTRESLTSHEAPSVLLEWATDIIVSGWETDAPDLLGICATLLSTSLHVWKPTESVLDKLKSLVERDLSDRDYTRIGVIEPLAFALDEKGKTDTYRRFLEAVVEDGPFREADYVRTGYFYGSQVQMLRSAKRHLSDPLRTGLRRANDIGRLMGLIIRPSEEMSHARARELLRHLLAESVRELYHAGEKNLARQVIKFLASYGIEINIG